MLTVEIRNDTNDDHRYQLVSEMIKNSPRHKVDFLYTENEGDKVFVITDREQEDHDEGRAPEQFITREQAYENPRKMVWDMIKFIPQLYCLDYISLYKPDDLKKKVESN